MPQILTIPVLRPLPLFVKGGNPLIPPFSKGGQGDLSRREAIFRTLAERGACG